MNRSRARRFRHITWLPMTAAVAVTASVPLLGCFEEDQTLGNDTDSGVPGSGTGSGTMRTHDSGAPGTGTGSGSGTPGTGSGTGIGATCGDGTCEAGETCSSCPVDCGPCGTGRDAGTPDTGVVTSVDSGTTPDSGASTCPATEGTSGTVLATGQPHLGDLVIDTENLYWATDVAPNINGTIFTLPKTGAGSPVTLAANQPSAFSIAVTGSTLYWSTGINSLSTPSSNFSEVLSLPLPATGTGTPAQFWTAGPEPLEGVYAFNMLADSTNLYWYDIGYSLFVEAPLNGDAAITLNAPDSLIDDPPVGLAIDDTTIYALWYGAQGSATPAITLVSTPKVSPGTWSTVWSQPAANTYVDADMTGDSSGIYWVYEASGAGTGTESIWTLPPGGTPTILVSGLNSPIGLAEDGVNVYYSDNNNIYKLPITGGTPTLVAANESTGTIRIDDTNIYWTNYCFGTIKKLAK